jgi:hypothetical protein
MDIPNAELSPVQPEKKVSGKYVFLCFVGVVLCASVGFMAGKFSTSVCNKSVLGIQAPASLSSRLALLFNIERPSQQIQTFQLAPGTESASPEPTEEPLATPTPEDGEPGMIWSGINRNPKPTPTSVPNNVITTPEQQNVGGQGDEETPTPTPKYKTNWDRNTPTPTPNNVIIEVTAEATKTSTPKPPKISVVPLEIQKFIDDAGVQMDKLEVIRSEGEEGVRVTGALHEKLFGLLPVNYQISIQVDEENGKIETASIPWWRTFFGNPFVGNISQIRCGDGICSSTESITSCKTDCEKVCGNGICEFGEGTDTCSQDCSITN